MFVESRDRLSQRDRLSHQHGGGVGRRIVEMVNTAETRLVPNGTQPPSGWCLLPGHQVYYIHIAGIVGNATRRFVCTRTGNNSRCVFAHASHVCACCSRLSSMCVYVSMFVRAYGMHG